jgi:putative peptide zinc metalloprotease protein
MNLAEALNAALPELPVHHARSKRFPRLNPKLIGREHIEEGKPVVVANIRGTTDLYRFSPDQWELIQCFDGVRNFDEVAEAFQHRTGIPLGGNDANEFAAALGDTFWYQTPQEKNIALQQKLSEQRHQHLQKASKFGDVSRIQVSHWDPDAYFDRVHKGMSFVYSKWFTGLTLLLFAFMVWVYFDRWQEIGVDTLKYYTFTEKSFNDIVEFWVLFFIMAFFHESSHGLTCKHFGGQVHQMGFHLIYLSPAFFVDVTEAWVYADRIQRLVTIISGIWVEMIFCGLGTVVWWGTAPGTYVHEIAYKLMLVTGVAVVLVNMNPLIKLDGYYFFCELIGIADIKEKSTAYVTGWIKKNIFRLPVELDYVPRRRRMLYIPYCILSGAYSYMLLIIAVRFLYHVMLKFSPDWAFVPAIWIGYKVFRSRIFALVRFMRSVYLDKREKLESVLTPRRLTFAAVVLALGLLLPWKNVSVEGRFLLEPASRVVLRANVPGTVSQVFVHEGEQVQPGDQLVLLRNPGLESEAGKARADAVEASSRATAAELTYTSFGPAEQARLQREVAAAGLLDQLRSLNVVSPLRGTVLTPRLKDSLGTRLPAGAAVVEVADLSLMRARIYVPETELRELRLASRPRVEILFDGMMRSYDGDFQDVGPATESMPQGLMHDQDYKGLHSPHFYAATVMVPNPKGELRDGMAGSARIVVGRQAPVVALWRIVADFVGRKLW